MKARTLTAVGRGLLAAVALAGCAAPAIEARESGISAARIDRVAWNMPPEPGLFRVRFEAALAQQLRRRAAEGEASTSLDPYHGEIRLLEQEADRELRARGLCSGSVRHVSYLDRETPDGGIVAVFKCGVSIF